jgi:hypothetical protein
VEEEGAEGAGVVVVVFFLRVDELTSSMRGMWGGVFEFCQVSERVKRKRREGLFRFRFELRVECDVDSAYSKSVLREYDAHVLEPQRFN